MAVHVLRPLSPATLGDIEPLYRAFQQVAQVDYGWPLSAVDFSGLRKLFSTRMMDGYGLYDAVQNQTVGFLFYHVESYRALELKVIYLHEDIPIKSALDTVMNTFLEDAKTMPDWDVISYPLLGNRQTPYVDFLTWYGFKPVGQAVVKFHLFDGLTLEIFQKLAHPPMPEGYRLISWDDQYEAGVVDVLTEAFTDSVDALWDPRFRTREGIVEAMQYIKSGAYGLFWPACNSILLNADNVPVGVCLMNIISAEEANIPLIGLLRSERQHKLGRTLLAHAVDHTIRDVVKGKLSVQVISATVATGNLPAVRMYRHTGFREEHWYPHVYQERDSVMQRTARQWC